MSLPAAPDVTLLFGPLLLGVLLNTMLYGVMIVQAFLYYSRYKGDRSWFRYLVLYLVIVETANWVCDVGLIYEPLIVRYGTPEALKTSPILLRADGVLTVLISTPIQLFIAWRIQVVNRSYVLPVIIFVLAVISFGGGLATTVVVTLHPDFANFADFHVEIITWLISSTLCDVVLTASLVYSLWTRKTNVISTDGYINKIIRLTIQTGFVTAAAALLDVVLFLTLPATSFNFMFDFPLSKLYTNALISTLNARPWQEHVSQHEAPNALFEESNMGQASLQGQTSFALTPRIRTSQGAHQSYMSYPQPPKFKLDIESAV
ncbi:hypothetical protein DFH08DRAFT_1077049 [Mycena albidolilacea]|uniref:DUF6534 domain-containing protein n=1 Tax=Mycena albidolilacea TaxID=1033008 RepID=A0AAD7ACR2_9AGAR|nr:hypothetical protein DFH08DRAFT_1077049 [Mycena albidolilacea]